MRVHVNDGMSVSVSASTLKRYAKTDWQRQPDYLSTEPQDIDWHADCPKPEVEMRNILCAGLLAVFTANELAPTQKSEKPVLTAEKCALCQTRRFARHAEERSVRESAAAHDSEVGKNPNRHEQWRKNRTERNRSFRRLRQRSHEHRANAASNSADCGSS